MGGGKHEEGRERPRGKEKERIRKTVDYETL